MNIMSLLNSDSDDEGPSGISFVAEDEIYNPEVEAYTVLRLLSCPLCGKLLSDPVTFPCGNTFCRGCLPIHPRFRCPIQVCTRWHEVNTGTDVSVRKLTEICRKEMPDLIPRVTQRSIRTDLQHGGDEFQLLERHFNDGYLSSSDDEEFYPHPGRTDLPENNPENNSNIIQFDLTRLKDLLEQEIECQVCCQLFIDPVTTPCGHTYCRPCLTRSLDHNDRCPLCRHHLRNYDYFLNYPINKTISTFITSLYPALHADRRQSTESKLFDDTQDVPIFVMSLIFPKMPCFLEIYEPSYRLMIRRCLESRKRQFGMLLRQDANYGTMLEIRSIETSNDGRSLVETIGTYRFRLVERGMRDGYMVGKIEKIEDIDPEQELEQERYAIRVADINNANPNNPRIHEPTISELIDNSRDFIESLRNGSVPWLLQRLNSTYGDMPDDPSDFSFWIASVIPIDENEKYRLIEETSVRQRLKMVISWVDQLRGQWWFARGCSIS